MQVDEFITKLGIEESQYRQFNLRLNSHIIGDEVKAALLDMSARLGRHVCQVSKRERLLVDTDEGEGREAAIHRLTLKLDRLTAVKDVVFETVTCMDKAGLTAMFGTVEQLQALKSMEAELENVRETLAMLKEEIDNREIS